jgi:hypothetical protein
MDYGPWHQSTWTKRNNLVLCASCKKQCAMRVLGCARLWGKGIPVPFCGTSSPRKARPTPPDTLSTAGLVNRSAIPPSLVFVFSRSLCVHVCLNALGVHPER